MKAAIVSLGSKSSLWTEKAMQKYFSTVVHLNLKNIEVNLGSSTVEILYNGKPMDDYDCVYVKGSFRYAPLLRAITSILSTKNVYLPLKPETFTLGHDKLLTQLILQKHKIPMPVTYLTTTTEAAREILSKITYPIVMKFPQGTQGKGVMFADSFSSASSLLDALTALKQPFLLQEYVETGGADIRAIVVGDKVVASMKRIALQGEKRANIHAGGHGEPCMLDDRTRKIAIDTAKAVGADICGVDILDGPKGPVVIEVNTSPGLQGITSATNINVADHIAKHLHLKTKDIVEGRKKEGAKDIMKDLGIREERGLQEIMSNIDMRGNRMLLPEILSKICRFSDEEELVFKAKEGKLEIFRFHN